jgi:TBC1 domain family member 2
MTQRLEDLVHRLDAELFAHFQAQGVMFQFFTTRWMNCALMRELPLRSILRLWDTYFAEEYGGFENFHVYVCVVLLKTYRDKLVKMEFQDMLIFLQNLPTADWGEEEVEPILSQAFILSTLFENSPSHLS